MAGLSSCVGDLDQLPKNPTDLTPDQFANNPKEYIGGALGKCYSGIAISGQDGPGESDISGLDNGRSCWSRAIFMLNEFTTDECLWIWKDSGVFDLCTGTWSSNNENVFGTYSRLYTHIAVCNDFIRLMIRLIDVHKEYDNGTKALRGIDLEIDDGEFVFLVGPSGSGKSTIVKLLTAEEFASQGRVMVNGFNLNNIGRRQIPHMRRTLGVIFQDFRLIEKKSVWENLEFAMRTIGSSGREMRRRIPYVLDLVGLSDKANVYPNEMSGGEQQRVAIARALVNNPHMIIADEPTGNLDPRRSLEIMTLLERINAMGTTMLVVTHERDLVNRFSKRVVAIKDGEMIRDGQGGYYRA